LLAINTKLKQTKAAEMFKVLVVGVPAAYVTGVVAFGGIYLTVYGSRDMTNAIA
jgi:hypothetical protein